ncbi:MAG: iron-sulfur cluster assembly scaffold protein [Hyphomonadaceae bacterium]
MGMDLYHPRVLELAAEISHIGRLPAPMGSSTKVSRICGSVVSVDLDLDGEAVRTLGMEVEACALGQAAAAILAKHAIGASTDEIFAARDALRAMLKEGAAPPEGRFWELRHLEGVRHYPPRHTSTMLAFEAACAAIEQARAGAVAV